MCPTDATSRMCCATRASSKSAASRSSRKAAGIFASVERASWVRAEAEDADGNTFTLEAEGLMAVCIQHEMDHLEGKVFVDYLSPLKRSMLLKKLDKQRRQAS